MLQKVALEQGRDLQASLFALSAAHQAAAERTLGQLLSAEAYAQRMIAAQQAQASVLDEQGALLGSSVRQLGELAGMHDALHRSMGCAHAHCTGSLCRDRRL